MLKYYGALSKAAEGLAPILPELENLLMRKYKINWVLFNKSLFYHYFYKKGDIKERMKKVRKVECLVFLYKQNSCLKETTYHFKEHKISFELT